MSSVALPAAPPLASASIALIKHLQTPEGAYPACPTFSAYTGFSWFRDGAFIADGMSAVGEHRSAEAFFDWCGRTIKQHAGVIARVVAGAAIGQPLPSAQMLPTRFHFDGSVANDGWENFQLDGYGTWIWALDEHRKRFEVDLTPYVEAVQLTTDYLTSSWDRPCYDWWEEHDEHVHISTLGCILAGLKSAIALDVLTPQSRDVAELAVSQIDALIREQGVVDGHLTKWIGTDAVDGSLASLIAPLGVIAANDPIAANTIAAIEREITVNHGVHRFAADTFFGGGQWPLLSCFAGLAHAALGDRNAALSYLDWAASTQTSEQYLPEQVNWNLLHPDYEQYWIDKWGPAATPLLWSHAMYLRLLEELS